MKKIIISLSILFFITACDRKNEIDSKYPDCLQSKIDNYISTVSPQTLRANVKIYNYQGEIIYAFYPGSIVEGTTTIFNKDCEIICWFGGFAGANTCENWDNATFLATVWEDPR